MAEQRVDPLVAARAVLAVVARPWLWTTALRVLLGAARRGWWRRPPFLPLPDSGYAEFRLTTAYGAHREHAQPDDLVDYLEWRRMLP